MNTPIHSKTINLFSRGKSSKRYITKASQNIKFALMTSNKEFTTSAPTRFNLRMHYIQIHMAKFLEKIGK